jgi:hypothetical protein
MFYPLVVQKKSPLSTGRRNALSCPHCKVGGHPVQERYVTVSIIYDAEEGYWRCLICGFIGFGNSYDLLQYRLVACLGGSPRLPGQKARAKRKPHKET